MFKTVGLFQGNEDALVVATVAPVVVLALVLSAPWLLRRGKPSRFQRVQQAAALVRGAMVQVRSGLQVFRKPKLGGWAALMQLTAWGIQWLACYVLLVALGLDDQAGLGAAAAVLFAVNVTAALPATPSNLGVFQAACVAVLSAYGVSKTNALAYGIILQAVEIATAVGDGHAGARARGHDVARSAPAGAPRRSCGAADTPLGAVKRPKPRPRALSVPVVRMSPEWGLSSLVQWGSVAPLG